jgi:penicillin amidase
MLVDKAGDNLKERGPFMATSIADILGNHRTEWCGKSLDKPTIDCNALIADALNAALDQLQSRDGASLKDWRWGHEHLTLLGHKVYSHIPFLKKRSDLTVESSGDFYTLDRGGSFDHDPKHPFARTHGGGYRGLYDLGDPSKSRFMITTGESGHIFSPHYGDLVPLWNNVKSITLSGTESELQAQGFPELILQPGAR